MDHPVAYNIFHVLIKIKYIGVTAVQAVQAVHVLI